MTNLLMILSILSSLATVVLVLYAGLTFKTQKESIIQQAKSLYLAQEVRLGTALFDIIGNEYLDRIFKSAKPPEIEGITINSLRIAKQKARQKYESERFLE
jgi:hypothetical protein